MLTLRTIGQELQVEGGKVIGNKFSPMSDRRGRRRVLEGRAKTQFDWLIKSRPYQAARGPV
jgi:hypothetical protein